jgi:hypothetical protein
MADWLLTLAIVCGLTALFALSLGAGGRLYRVASRGRPADGASTSAGFLVGATLGLLSLLIGFTLALSLDRFEARRLVILKEANAVQAAWLRDQLLDAPYRGQLDSLLRTYIRSRLQLASIGLDPAALDAQGARDWAIQQRIWRETAVALQTPNDTRIAVPVLQATNEMFGLTGDRRAALDAQVPTPVLAALVIVAVIAAAITGYGLEAGGRRHRIASTALFAAASLIIALIIDLDEPWAGMIRISQAPFERVAASILNAPPVQ